jgi:hypothetical protein
VSRYTLIFDLLLEYQCQWFLPEELKSHQESKKVMPERELEVKEKADELEVSQNKEAQNSWNSWFGY